MEGVGGLMRRMAKLPCATSASGASVHGELRRGEKVLQRDGNSRPTRRHCWPISNAEAHVQGPGVDALWQAGPTWGCIGSSPARGEGRLHAESLRRRLQLPNRHSKRNNLSDDEKLDTLWLRIGIAAC